MAELNKVLMIGRLTRDPELKYTPSGTAVCELRLAVNHTYRTQEGKKEETCFIDVSVFGRQAETVNQYLSKGREVFVEGRLKHDTWETQDGQKRSKHTMIADRFQFLGGGGGGGGRGERTESAPADPEAYDARPAQAPAVEDDDLPF